MEDWDIYAFTVEPSEFEGFAGRLRWTKNGKDDPLNFWDVPVEIGIDAAKEVVRCGELDG